MSTVTVQEVRDNPASYLTERYHDEGCPMDPSRLETYEAVAKSGKAAGRNVLTVRCCDCGGMRQTAT